jgi:putative chitinase
MQISYAMLTRVMRRKPTKRSADNAGSFLVALNDYGARVGLLEPHRLAIFLANIMHECAEFYYDQEVWGPTAAQKRYEDRTDLGHSAAVDGEAFLFRGRTGIQITGRTNYRKFTAWARSTTGLTVDFEKEPDLLLTDPWEGLGPIWYWDVGNPEGKSLNRYADKGDHEMVRRRINGGLNGYDDVLTLYDRIALVMLGYGPTDIAGFQKVAKASGVYKGNLDGDSGPQTRAALHAYLAALSNVATQAAPVVQETVVVPDGTEKVAAQRTGGALAIVSPLLAWAGTAFAGLDQTGVFILLGLGVVGAAILLWRGELIAARARSVLKSFRGVV